MSQFAIDGDESAMALVLNQALSISETVANLLVNNDSMGDDTLSGAELWSKFNSLGKITELCGNRIGCYLAFDRKFFVNKLEAILKTAAAIDSEGDADEIESQQEMTYIGQEFTDAFSNQAKQSIAAIAAKLKITKDNPIDVRTWLQAKNISAKRIQHILSSTTTQPTFHASIDKNEGVPDTVNLYVYLPTSTDVPVDIHSAFNILVTNIDQFANWTTLYENIAISNGARAFAHLGQGSFETQVTLKLEGAVPDAFPVFEATNRWLVLGPEFGPNQGAFMNRISLKPGTAVSYNLIAVSAVEATVLALPVQDGSTKGIVIHLELDMDLANVPNTMIDWMMENEVKRLVEELATAYVKSLQK